MKKHLFSLAGVLVFGTLSLQAQDWVSMMQNTRANLNDVHNAFYKWYAKQPKAKKADHDAKDVGDREENDESLANFSRWEWFMRRHAAPDGSRPDPVTIEKDYKSFLTSSNTHRANKNVQRIQAAANWNYAGNTSVPIGGGGAGRVCHIRVMPGNSNTMFACTPSGGLWKTTNGGTSWSTATDQIIDLAVSDIAINPLNTNMMYLSTGDGDGAYAGYTPTTVGVLKSTDGGNSWAPTGLYLTLPSTGPSIATVNELLINPVDTNIVFAATSFGLYYTSNSGMYWTKVLAGVDVRSIQFEGKHPTTVYAATADGKFFMSTNSGTSFTQITSGLPTAGSAGRMIVGTTPADSTYVYVLASDPNGGFYGLYLSTDKGVSFTRKSNSPDIFGWNTSGSGTGGQGWYDLSLVVSPTNRDTIVIGGVNVWMSSNDGTTWKNKSSWTGSGSSYVHADIHHITILPNSARTWIVACDGGVFKTTNAGSWSDASSNLEIAQQYGIGVSQKTAGLYLTGWQDNGTNLSGAPWNQTIGGDGTMCFIDYTTDNNMFGSYPYGTLYYSSNAGGSWNTIGTNITETGPWLTMYVEDPNVNTTVYCGFSNVWKCTNAGSGNFTQISTWGNTSGAITALAVAPSNSNYIYAAQNNQIEYTSNGGTSWTDITGTLPVTSAGISAIGISNSDPKRAWVVFYGYSAANKVFETKDAGGSWSNMSTGLPNLPINCVVYQKSSPDGIYIGMDGGVYYHDTIINTWVNYSNGMPNTVIQDIHIYYPGNQLVAATFGRGTWQTALYTSPGSAPVAHFTAYPTTFCVGDTVQFTEMFAVVALASFIPTAT